MTNEPLRVLVASRTPSWDLWYPIVARQFGDELKLHVAHMRGFTVQWRFDVVITERPISVDEVDWCNINLHRHLNKTNRGFVYDKAQFTDWPLDSVFVIKDGEVQLEHD